MRGGFRWIIRLWALLLIGNPLFGQDDQEIERCGQVEDEDAKELLEKGEDRGSYKLRKRNQFLRKALEKSDSCSQCRYKLGLNNFKIAKLKPRVSYKKAERHFKRLIRTCPDYHADAWFRLGLIHYGREDYAGAVKYFQAFLDFDAKGDLRYTDEYAKRVKDARGMMAELEAYAELYGDTVDFDPRLVKGVSSKKADEYLPMLSPDDQMMFYTRRYRKDSKDQLTPRKVEELTVSERRSVEGAFDKGEALPEPFNQGDNYGGVTISVDNRELYVTICKQEKKGYKNCDIYRSTYSMVYDSIQDRKVYQWSEPEPLGDQVNTSTGWESQPSLSGDGKSLYFAAHQKNTKESDIFVTRRDGLNDEWGRARPLSSTINTEKEDKTPFMHSDSRTLYFASNGHIGVGKYDLFYSRLKDDSTWTEPENLGIPINTDKDELGLIVSSDGKIAYFSSDRLGKTGTLDIYSFELPEDVQAERVMIVKGNVNGENGRPIQGAKVELKNINSKEVNEIPVDSTDGHFAAAVKADEKDDVTMTVKKDGYAFNARLLTDHVEKEGGPSGQKNEKEFVTTDGPGDNGQDRKRNPNNRHSRGHAPGGEPGHGSEAKNVEKRTIELKKERVGEPYTLQNIHYETNKASLKPRSRYILNEFVEHLKENPSVRVSIHGHTDNVGTEKDNLALSQDRAFTVMKYLQDRGVSEKRLEFKGFGENKPIASNETAEGRAKNRRTEFVILEK